MTAEKIKNILGLKPLPREGGFYVETYRSEESVPQMALPERYGGDKALSTAIYYFLTPDTFSALHRLPTDEVYHFYLGDPVELVQLRSGGTGSVTVLGTDLAAGMRPQVVVPSGVWQGSRLRAGGRFALLGTTMAPGFDPEDYEAGARVNLLRDYPGYANFIQALTR